MAHGQRVSAVVGCVDDAGRVLIVKQTAGPFSGSWLLPGGNVEPNESPEDAAQRELFEETGYRADVLTPVARYEVKSVPAGGFHFTVHLFRAATVEGSPRPEAGSALRWTTPGEIELHPNLAVALVDLGLLERDQVTLAQDLAKLGVAMRRIWRVQRSVG